MFGIGGGIILVPSLVFLFRFTQQTASGMSLVALLLPVGLLGVLEYHRAGKFSNENIKMGFLVSLGMFLGTYFGAKIATNIPAETMRKAFAGFLVVVALRLWFFK
jgi:uncharacterized membrane protein YfcA